MSTLETFLNGVEEIITLSPYKPTVVFDELTDFSKGTFPRIEIDLPQAEGADFVSQRELEWRMHIMVTGFLGKEKPDGAANEWSKNDKINIMNFGMDTVSRMFSLFTAKQDGIFICPSFLYWDGYPKVNTFLELIPGISSFIVIMTARFQQLDEEDLI